MSLSVCQSPGTELPLIVEPDCASNSLREIASSSKVIFREGFKCCWPDEHYLGKRKCFLGRIIDVPKF